MNMTTKPTSRGTLKKKRQSGFATSGTIIAVSLSLLGVVVSVTNASLTQVKMSQKAQSKAAALSLAEAGAEETVSKIKSDLSYGSDGLPIAVSLYEDAPTNTKLSGTYSVSVKTISPTVRKVLSTGTPVGGLPVTVAVMVNVPTHYTTSSAALRVNGDLTVKGNMLVKSVAGLLLHESDVEATGDIKLKGDANFVDGTLTANGTISGMGAGDLLNAQVVAILPDVPQLLFPDNNWRNQMDTDFKAKADSQFRTYAPPKNGILGLPVIAMTAPARITGDLKLTGIQLMTITGNGVIYVDGDVDLEDNAKLINGATLAVRGKFLQTKSASYTASIIPLGSLTTAPSLTVFNNKVDTGAAITLTGSTTPLLNAIPVQVGVVYAAYGDILVNGNVSLSGALAAGGPDSNISCDASLTLVFPGCGKTAIGLPGEPEVTFWGEI